MDGESIWVDNRIMRGLYVGVLYILGVEWIIEVLLLNYIILYYIIIGLYYYWIILYSMLEYLGL